MAAPFVGIGFFELVILLAGGGLMGLPPGERDAKLLHCPPADSILYVEWAERSTGKAGAGGIDGLAADPEIRHFLTRLDAAFKQAAEKDDAEGPPAQLYAIVRQAVVRPGCAFASIDTEKLKAVMENPPQGASIAKGALTAVKAGLVVNAGDEADEIDSAIRSLIALATDGEKPEDLKMRELPQTGGIPLLIHRHENYFILALGKAAAEGAVAGLTGKSDGLAKHAALTEGLKQTAVERVGGVAWLDLGGLLERLSEGLGTQGIIIKTMASTVGLDAIKSVTSTAGVTGGEIHQRTFVATNGKTDGLLSLAGGRAIKAADLAHLPADSDMAVAVSIDGKKVFDSLKEIAGKADPGALKAVENAVAQLESDLGLSLEKDIFGSMGNVWTLHDSPEAGGVIFTGGVLSVEVKDREKAKAVVAKFLQLFNQELNRNGAAKTLEDHEFLGQTVTTIDSRRGGPPVQLAVCVTDKHVYLALQPQAIKAQLRFLASKKPGLDTQAKSLLLPKGDVLSATYVDARTAVRLLTTLVPYWGKNVVDEVHQRAFEFDQFDIPSAAAYLPYVTPAVSAWTRAEDGLHAESRGGAPIPGGLSPLIGLAMGLTQVRAAHTIHGIHGDVAPPAAPVPAVIRPVARPAVRIEVAPIKIEAKAEKVEKVAPKKQAP